jgi:hypothetical protein
MLWANGRKKLVLAQWAWHDCHKLLPIPIRNVQWR